MPKALSPDLRQRIIDTWLLNEDTLEEIAERFCVSRAVVAKLTGQYRRTGSLQTFHHRAGRKRLIAGELEERLGQLVDEQPDSTLEELRQRLGLACSLTAIHNALSRMGESYKKKGRGGRGAGAS